uniref:Uncharacterized protein n=1 Tax=Lactuca sativa TaxID=4236 RepID=A0A9R1V6E6_LACSA|nr:hypothetical protein LSAT_V11C600326790 [Lactuca sativa]
MLEVLHIAGTYQVIEASADSLFDGRSYCSLGIHMRHWSSCNAHAEIGLHILAQTIQDDLVNITRFLILGIEKPHKTSIVFTLEEGPRVLFNALDVFALREINLSKCLSLLLGSLLNNNILLKQVSNQD